MINTNKPNNITLCEILPDYRHLGVLVTCPEKTEIFDFNFFEDPRNVNNSPGGELITSGVAKKKNSH